MHEAMEKRLGRRTYYPIGKRHNRDGRKSNGDGGTGIGGDWDRAMRRGGEGRRGVEDGVFRPMAKLVVERARPERHRLSLFIGLPC